MRRIIFCLIAMTMLSLPVGGENAEKPAALTLKDMQGKKASLRDLRGKIVVLNFWATWCGPCNAEMPMLVGAASSYDARRVAFVGASVDSPETQSKIQEYVRKLSIKYPIWTGATDDDMKHLQLGNVVPSTAFLDADGIVRARILGQMRPGEIQQRVDWLLSDRAGSAPPAVVKHLDE